ncbi:DOMON-like domain-containing protein [Brevundimonas staleyi]|uniref:DOMON-like domain-containing protein n=1 Tax=Brevundimonas staleyi TaxID=74326 RepID=A0ABW0FQ49_9CAUL
MLLELSLAPYPGTGLTGRVDVVLDWEGRAAVHVAFKASGFEAGVVLPETDAPTRKDELWRHTCCEIFALRRQGGYVEFNLAPSGDWAAYSFDGYRQGMANLDSSPPDLRMKAAEDGFELSGFVHLAEWPLIEAIGLSAVIETPDGAKTYWALAHPSDKPDFHHPDSFTVKATAATYT